MNQDVRLWYHIDRDGQIVLVADADLDTWWIDQMMDGGDTVAPPATTTRPYKMMMGIGI